MIVLPLLAMEVPTAPVDGSNGSVLLWAVGILIGALFAAVIYVKSQVDKNEKACSEDRDECKEAISGYHKRIEGLMTGVIAEQSKRAEQTVMLLAANQKSLERTSEALDRNTDIIAVLGRTEHGRNK